VGKVSGSQCGAHPHNPIYGVHYRLGANDEKRSTTSFYEMVRNNSRNGFIGCYFGCISDRDAGNVVHEEEENFNVFDNRYNVNRVFYLFELHAVGATAHSCSCYGACLLLDVGSDRACLWYPDLVRQHARRVYEGPVRARTHRTRRGDGRVWPRYYSLRRHRHRHSTGQRLILGPFSLANSTVEIGGGRFVRASYLDLVHVDFPATALARVDRIFELFLRLFLE